MAIFIAPSLILSTPPTAVISASKFAHIGYESFVTADNITASSQTAGFPSSSLANPLTFEKWKPTTLSSTITVDAGTAVTANYIGIAAHTFATDRAVITIETSIDNLIWTEIIDASPGDNKPIMVVFGDVSSRYWRISIEALSIPSIGVLYIGESLIMQRGIYGGHTPITMGRNSKVIRNKTEGGQFAGVSIINEGVEGKFSWSNLTATWYRNNFDPFVVAARSKPFFIAWRPGEYPDEIGYVWATSDIIPSNNGTRDLMDVTMSVSGFSDE